MASKPGERRLQILQTLAAMLETPRGEKVTTAAWKTRPSWFIIVNDRMVPPQSERDAAKRIKATTITLNSGHVPMLSNPRAVAAVIIDAATKAGSR